MEAKIINLYLENILVEFKYKDNEKISNKIINNLPTKLTIEEIKFYYKGKHIDITNEDIKAKKMFKHKKIINIFGFIISKKGKFKNIICPECKIKEQCILNFDKNQKIICECINGHKIYISLEVIKKNKLIYEFSNNCRCKEHNNKIYKFCCIKCKKNLCYKCNIAEHTEHNNNLILYNDIIPNYDNYVASLELKSLEFRYKLNIFNHQTKSIKFILNEIVDNLELFYNININIIHNYYVNKNNYISLKNIEAINFRYIEEDICEIIDEENLKKKIHYILKLYKKLTNKKECIIKFNEIFNIDSINTTKLNKYKLKYYSLIKKMSTKDVVRNKNKNEFLCNILLMPSITELSNKLPCLEILCNIYNRNNKKSKLIYNIAKKCEKYILNTNLDINIYYYIQIFYLASSALYEEKNYFYAIKYIQIALNYLTINKTNCFPYNIAYIIRNYYNKIQQEIYDYLAKERQKYKQMNLNDINYLKTLMNSILNEEYMKVNYSDMKNEDNNFLYVINKNWLNKAKLFLDYYIPALENEQESFLEQSFKLDFVYNYYFSDNIINNKKIIPSYPGPINNYEITSFKDSWNKEDNLRNSFISKNLKLNSNYYLIKSKDWKIIKEYFGATNKIKRKKDEKELLEIKFILFDKRIKSNNNTNLLKGKYIQINKNVTIRKFKDKILNYADSELKSQIIKKEEDFMIEDSKKKNYIKDVAFYILDKEKRNILIEICYAFIFNLLTYESIFITKLEHKEQNSIIDLFQEYNKTKNVLIIEVFNKNEMNFLNDLKINENYKCKICNKKIFNLENKYNCNICHLSLFCSEECAKNNKDHIKLDNLLKIILEKQFILDDFLCIKLSSFLNDKSLLGRVTLKNIENTDYINSIIYCLSNTQDLTKYFIGKFFEKEINIGNITNAIYIIYYNLLQQLWNQNESIITNKSLYSYISNDEKDSYKCLLDLLNKLHKNLNRASNVTFYELPKLNEKNDEEKLKKNLEYYKKYNNSIITDLFHVQSLIKCCSCNFTQILHENYFNLELFIPPKNTQFQIKFFKLNGTYIDLNFCLDNDNKFKDIIQKATDYLDEKNYLKGIIGIENKNEFDNELDLLNSILYNSIEIVEFNKEYKLTNIYKTNYSSINEDKENNNKFFDNATLSEIYKKNYNSEIVLYERDFRNEEIYIYVYPIFEKPNNGVFGPFIDNIFLSYPVIIYIKTDESLKKLKSLIYRKFKNILIMNKDKSDIFTHDKSIKICYPHFSDGWGMFNQKNNECCICKKKYSKNMNDCELFDTLDKNTKISELIKFIPNNQLILYAKSQKYDITKNIYSGMALFKDNINISNNLSYINIYDCLKYVSEEKLFCEKCNKKYSKKFEIYKPPLYLIAHFKRFSNKNKGNKISIIKNSIPIYYNEILNLKDFIINQKNENYLYDLYGVIINIESSSIIFNNKYHNKAFCKNQGNWISYDDEKIDKINTPYDKDAYLLFYKLRKNT